MNRAHRSYLKVILSVLVLAIVVGGFAAIMGVLSNCGTKLTTPEDTSLNGTYKEVSKAEFDEFVGKVEDNKYGLKLNLKKGFKYSYSITRTSTAYSISAVENRDIIGSQMYASYTSTQTIGGVPKTMNGEVWDDGEMRYYKVVSDDETETYKTTNAYESIQMNVSIEDAVEGFENSGTVKYYIAEEGQKAKIEFTSADGAITMTARYAYSSSYELRSADVTRRENTEMGGIATVQNTSASIYMDTTVKFKLPDVSGYVLKNN